MLGCFKERIILNCISWCLVEHNVAYLEVLYTQFLSHYWFDIGSCVKPTDQLTNQPTNHQPIPWHRVLLETLTVPLSKKFPTFYGTLKFITVFTRTCCCPCPRLYQSSPCPPLSYFLAPMPWSSKWSLSLRFPHQSPVCTSPLPHVCTRLNHCFLVDLITQTILGEEQRSRSDSLCCVFHSSVTSLLCPNIFLSSQFSNTLSPCSSLNLTDLCVYLKTRTKLKYINWVTDQPPHRLYDFTV